MGMQGNNLYIFLSYLKSEVKKKIENLNLKKLVCLKKLRLNLKQKTKLYIRNTHF